MVNNREWYGRDWKILRTQLVKLCLLNSEALLAGLQEDDPVVFDLVEDFLAQLHEEISRRITVDRIGLWQHTLDLLIQGSWLAAELARDLDVLRGGKMVGTNRVLPKQALARKMMQFFEMNRREHIANEQGVSANKVKTWERLDRISRDIARQSETGNRCNEEHFEKLARHVKTRLSHDKNLPRRSKTVMGYFYRFSEDCVEHIDDQETTMDQLSLAEARELMRDVGVVELSRCLGTLPADDLELLDASFGLGLSKVVYRSVEDFLHNKKLGRKEYDTKLQHVLTMLGHCLEIGLAARQGGLD